MISKIAIFRALHLGDMLCIIPTVRAIRMAWPSAEIALIGLPWQNDFVQRFNRYFDRFIEFPGWPGLPEREPDAEKILAFLDYIRSQKFDLVFQLQGNGEITNSMCMLWGAKRVSGLRKSGEYEAISSLFPVSQDGEHEITRFFKILHCLNIPVQGTDLEYPITREEEIKANQLLQSVGIRPHEFICIHPGARDVRRRWPVDNFAFIANQLATRDCSIVLTGSAEEAAVLSTLQENVLSPVINVVESFGHLTAGELAAILKRARMLVSNDTGVSHLAVALAVPSVIIFSRYSSFERWRPLNSKLHHAIPFEAANDAMNVLAKVMETLAASDRSKHSFVS